MAKFGVYFKEDGTVGSNMVFTENHIPPESVTPPGLTLVIVDRSTKDYDILYGLFVEDQDKKYANYVPYTSGGITYNFDTKEFSFAISEERDIRFIDEVRVDRDQRLKFTDELALIPDLPDSLKAELIEYRQQLRDITKNIDPSWESMNQVVWPELPTAFKHVAFTPS